MASGHPVDELGRVLPECGWPTEKAAPGDLELVRRFCNTCNKESGAYRLDSTSGLDRWLSSQGLDEIRALEDDLKRITEFRELLRSHAIEHSSRSRTAPGDLSTAVADIDFGMVDRDGLIDVDVASGDPVRRFIGTLALIVMRSQHDGTWIRMKACRHCRWVVFDSSKNRSGFWCSMRACGGRSKVNAYRTRHAR
jgi:predicted RNA-binding Zn ribbon-like protein